MKKSLLAMMLCTFISSPSYSVTPDQILSDDINKTVMRGFEIRKGTIGALIVNTKVLNKGNKDTHISSDGLEALKHIRETIKGVYGVGLFDMLPLEGWLSDESKPGNILVAAIALQELPNLMSPLLQNRIRTLSLTQPKYVYEELKKLL